MHAVWRRELFDRYLEHFLGTIISQRNAIGWQELAVTMQVPDGAGRMVISLAAASADELDPKITFNLNDVRV